MLQIAIDSNIPFAVQQNAAIQLKNLVCKNWKFGNDMELNKAMRFEDDEKIIVINELDKDSIRNNIFNAFLLNTNKLIRKQFCECLKKICKFELSNKFSFVIDNIIACFTSGEDAKIFAGVIIFYNISKLFSVESGEYKLPYTNAFLKLHDFLMNFILTLLDKYENPEACFIIYKIIKIYFLSTQTDLNDIVTNPDNMEKWMKVLLYILEKKYTGDLIKKTNDTSEIKILEKNIYWKIKIYAMKIFSFAFYKHSHKSKAKDPKMKEYSNLITNVYAVKFYEVSLNSLYASKNEFLPDALGCAIYKFFADLVSKNHLIDKIEASLETILKDYIIQSAFLRKEDIELWKHEMKDFIMKEYDIVEWYDSERQGVLKFLKELSIFRRKVDKKKEKFPAYFEIIFKFLVTVLETYENQVKTGHNPDYRIKEATLYLIENLEEQINK